MRSAFAMVVLLLAAVVTPAPAATTPSWWHPSPGTTWQIQFSGSLDTGVDAVMYDIDLFDTPASVIAQLKTGGHKVVCYYSAGSYEDWRPDANRFPPAVLGNALDGWPGERWLDVRRLDVLRPIMGARLDLAAQKGCDAIDADNVDGYANRTGFPLTSADQLAYNRWTARAAHARGLAAGLKNDLGQISGLVADYDFSVNEQCFEYDECQRLTPFVAAGKPVFNIEYRGTTATLCPKAATLGFDTLRKRLDLGAWRLSCT